MYLFCNFIATLLFMLLISHCLFVCCRDLSGNKLRSLSPAAFQHLVSLQQLKLNFNQLEAIPNLGYMASLAELGL